MRHEGTIVRAEDTHGFLKSGNTVFYFNVSDVRNLAVLRVNDRVSFRATPNPKHKPQMMAVDIELVAKAEPPVQSKAYRILAGLASEAE